MHELKHHFACDTCLDRGWIIEQGFSPALEHHAEFVPCPACRPAERKPTQTEQWIIAAAFFAVLLAAILLV